MDPELTFEECLNALVFKKQDFTENEEIVINIKKKQIKEFTNLLEYYMQYKNISKIKSSVLTNLYLFFLEGTKISNTFDRIDKEKMEYLINMENPLYELFKDKIENMVEIGTFFYQLNYNLTLYKYKLKIIKERYEKIFSKSKNPIDWFKTNDNSYEIVFNVKPKENLDDYLNKLKLVDNENLDPVFQK